MGGRSANLGETELYSGANISGAVRLRVTSNGSNVTGITPESGDPFLLRDAAANLRTWRFTGNQFRTFEVTYNFQATADWHEEFLKEPGVVNIYDEVPPVNGITANFEVPWQTWRAQLVSSRGTMGVTLSLKLSDAELDPFLGDYLDGRIIGPGNHAEPISKGHREGDMLGFDARVNGPNGKPLRVSLLGKQTGNKITGVFLDYSGRPGTWTAVRQRSNSRPSR